jgi:hypothetical protein
LKDFICFGAEEEMEEVIEKVSEALEENFTELEKMKAKKVENPEAAKNGGGDVEMADAEKTDSDEKPKNGEAKTENGNKPGNLNPSPALSFVPKILFLKADIFLINDLV